MLFSSLFYRDYAIIATCFTIMA